MKRKTPPPAKLTRPSAGELLKRERLFAMLDAARAGKVVWITAPPGAGKTSLLATWIEARGLPCLWYAIDPGDADPASLFYRFATAARDGFGAVDIPPFGEGGGVPIGVFARRFFEAALAGIEPPLEPSRRPPRARLRRPTRFRSCPTPTMRWNRTSTPRR